MGETIQDDARCEIRILGMRHALIDVEALCNRLDLIVGSRVAEVIINQHMSALGREDATRIREEKPQATARQILDILIEADCTTGVGVTKVTAAQGLLDPVEIEVSNPCVRKTVGSAKSFLFSYWCGVLTCLSGRQFRIGYAVYDESRNLTRCQLVPG